MTATVSRTANGAGIQSATWDCPGILLATTDSIVIRVYDQIGTGAVTERASLTTTQLGATQIDATTWTVYYYTARTSGGSGANQYTGATFNWGTTTYDSRVENFQYTTTVARDPRQDNTLNWTASASPDVDHYNIYRATVVGGPYTLIDAVPVGTNTYVDSMKGNADGTLWWYRVRAVDVATNEETNTNNVQELGGGTPPAAYNINLVGKTAGQWVLVSFPIDISGNIQTILNDAGTTWDVAKGYNSLTKTWTTYRATGTQTLTTVNNQMGVWLHLTANGGDQLLTTATTGLYSTSAVNIDLDAGWNLVGYPSATSRAESATLPLEADMVSVWQVGTPYITDHAKGATLMSAGNAYWVRVTADCVWTVNP
jgi:hypothetical protein